MHVWFGALSNWETRELFEKVQRSAIKMVPSLKDKSYYDSLVSLNLPSLLYRRRRIVKVMVYLIVRGLAKGILI